MQRNSNRIAAHTEGPFRSLSRRWIRGAAGVGVMATLIAVAQPPQQSPTTGPDAPYLRPEANRLPDKNDQMKLNSDQVKRAHFDAANAERKKQIADDTAKLLELATELKSEVDKTSKDTLSINVIRKAESIERLAKGVKEKMKLTVGAG
jgi:hypothetical protein